ncbi:hypothetical protein GCM10018790_50710 [Kitasatospora xanthocidica]|uniref:hypothetical protein n=1 Tax=Kitasatospora xanthocidica TaxID=83382 RepID=UPI0016737749|nr:hypothetical protein [Kitasatospora xanthocidica]GHF66584.1 hypothetical protein GCM10018790_50710 [Kitasatospora xanthocidica]
MGDLVVRGNGRRGAGVLWARAAAGLAVLGGAGWLLARAVAPSDGSAEAWTGRGAGSLAASVLGAVAVGAWMAAAGALGIALVIGAVDTLRGWWRAGRRSGMSAGSLLAVGVAGVAVLAWVHTLLTDTVPEGSVELRSHPGAAGFMSFSYGPDLLLIALTVAAVGLARGCRRAGRRPRNREPDARA